MADPFASSDTTPRFDLPYLHVAQVQKEFFVNEALSRIDTLLHCLVEGETAAPPPDAADGQAWLIAAGATGDWAGRAGCIATYQAGNWLFMQPREGMRAFDRMASQELLYAGTWRRPLRPTLPSGGGTVDAEARSAIVNLVNALTLAGMLPAG